MGVDDSGGRCVRIDTPEAPRSLEMVDVSRAGITLQWDVPRHDGGSPVSGYVLERAQAYSNRFLRLAHLLSAGETSYRDVSVHDGYEYEYRVCAENEAGEGPFSKVLGPIAARDRFGTRAPYTALNRARVDSKLCHKCVSSGPRQL